MEKTNSPNLSVVPEYRELVRLVRTWLIPEALHGNVRGHVPGLLSWRVGWHKPVVKVTLELQLEQIEESGMLSSKQTDTLTKWQDWMEASE